MFDTSTDQSQLNLMLGGDEGAFQTVVAGQMGPLSRYIKRMVARNEDAEEIVQETFLALWVHRHDYNASKAQLTTWLHRIAHNLIVDQYRKESLRWSLTVSDSSQDKAVDIEDSRADPVKELEQIHQSSLIRAALMTLDIRQRSAVVLCHYQGVSNHAAAQIIGVSVAALESLLVRARKKLKEELKEEPKENLTQKCSTGERN